MKNRIGYVWLSLLAFGFSGCLVGHRIIYHVKPDKAGAGTAAVYYTDIRSDAANQQEFEEDKRNLFQYMLKSNDFIQDMKNEGKIIETRNLEIQEGKLTGKAVFRFNKLSDVENLAFEDGFYFLTLALDDSVVYTNGEVIKSSGYKRILWDDRIDTLKFEILTEPASGTNLRELAPVYKEGNY